MHSKKYLIPVVGLILLNGCAHSIMRGTVAMKDDDREAHVCLGDKEVKVGDRVALFRNQCARGGGKVGAADPCHKVKIGEGEVIQTLNEHYSIVRVDSGVPFEEGTIIEKE